VVVVVSVRGLSCPIGEQLVLLVPRPLLLCCLSLPLALAHHPLLLPPRHYYLPPSPPPPHPHPHPHHTTPCPRATPAARSTTTSTRVRHRRGYLLAPPSRPRCSLPSCALSRCLSCALSPSLSRMAGSRVLRASTTMHGAFPLARTAVLPRLGVCYTLSLALSLSLMSACLPAASRSHLIARAFMGILLIRLFVLAHPPLRSGPDRRQWCRQE